MILTVTMNPSVDISYPLDELEIDSINRVSQARKEAGGKGLNVARVIRQADEEVLATGLIGGYLGQYITSRLDNINVDNNFYSIAGESRNCIALLHQGLQTEILEAGPEISPEEQQQFLAHFTHLIRGCRIVTLSGSLPKGVAKDFYRRLIQLANVQEKPVLLDCSGECLKSVVNGGDFPLLIKPNQQELEQLTGGVLDPESVESFITMVNGHSGLQKIPWIIVSLGKAGAFARINGKYYTASIPQINAVNPVGSGDATIAGLAIAIYKQESPENALKRAMAFGILNAKEEQTGCINMADFSGVFNQVNVYPHSY